MSKSIKKLTIAILFAVITLLASSAVFANEGGLQKAGDAVRNTVGGAENAIEGAAGGVANGVKGGLNTAGEATKNTVDDAKNGMNTAGTTARNTGNDGYDATRTATAGGTFAGMNSTVWTWFILAIAALAIIGLVWYYAMQTRSQESNRD